MTDLQESVFLLTDAVQCLLVWAEEAENKGLVPPGSLEASKKKVRALRLLDELDVIESLSSLPEGEIRASMERRGALLREELAELER